MKLSPTERFKDFAIFLMCGAVLSCLVGIISPINLFAQKPRPASKSEKTPEQMSFSLHYEDGGSSSQFYLLANGPITSDTPRRFETFLRTVKDGQPVIYFNSFGGNLMAGIELGRIIRSRGLDTYVGGEYVSFSYTGQTANYRTLVKQSACLSACAYAFLGGASRNIASDSAFGVHQFSGKQDVGESLAQVSITVLANYLDEMGVDRKVLDIASLTSPNKIQLISIDLSQQLNIDNTNPPKGDWAIRSDDEGRLSAILTQKQAGKNGVVTIILQLNRGDLVMTMIHRIRQKFRSQRDLVDIFQSDHNPPKLCAESEAYCDKSYEFVGGENWKQYEDGGFTTVFRLTPETVLQMTEVKNLEFDSGFGNVVLDVAPDVTFSTKNLRGIVTALLKQR